MKMLCKSAWLIGVSLLALYSCSEPVEPGKIEPNPEPEWSQPIEYHNANLIYYGAEDDIGPSSYFRLTLFTDMELDEKNNPVGPGQMLRLSINASLFEATPEGGFQLPVGTYTNAQTDYEFLPFTFNNGFMVQLDLPEGKIEQPDGTFFGDIASGQTTFDADLLNEGAFEVSYSTAGICEITGIAVGAECVKRKFIYRGELVAIDRREHPDETPNTNLTTDLQLENLKHARLHDRGDYYFLGDESCRTVELRLCEQGFDLSQMWPTGSGRMLLAEVFVAWDTDVEQGIPAGEYRVVARMDNGGIAREQIIPGGIASGYPNKFEYPDGTWYQRFSDGKLTEYARIDEGVMTVTRNGDAHTIVFEFKDCDKAHPHRITGTYSQQTPIDVFKFQ